MGERTCMEAAIAKLNYRMRTEAELEKSLKELGYTEEDIEATLEELKTFGYVDDERYVREFYRTSRRKSWSRSRIVRALREKGISGSLANDTIDDFEDSDEFTDLGLSQDERELALKVGRDMARVQMGRDKPLDDNFLKKVGRRLTSLGYDTGCCFYVMNKLKDEARSMPEGEDEL